MRISCRAALRWFSTGPDLPPSRLPEEALRTLYERLRWQVFLSITIGYGIFYVGRVNFGVLKKHLLDEGVLTGTQMGVIGSAMLVAYAVGKAINGFLADRSNVGRFMPVSLLAVAFVNAMIGFAPAFTAILFLWALNGWAQSSGGPLSIAALANWFSPKERGSRYGIWSVSHGLGEMTTFAITATVVGSFGWKAGFFMPSLVCFTGALILFKTLRDRPETLGLPPVSEYMRDYAPTNKRGLPTKALQAEVLRNPAIWVLACSSALIYVPRYGMNHWGFLYLQEGKGLTMQEAGFAMSLYSGACLAGSFFSGIISDKFFGARRSMPCFLAGIVQVSTLALVHLLPPGYRLAESLVLAVLGFAMGMLIAYLGGLMAVDIVSPRAVGAAAGIVGLFSYIGAAVQDSVSGYLVDIARAHTGPLNTNYGNLIMFWLAASVISLILPLIIWRRLNQAR